MTPVSRSAAATTNSAPIIRTPELANPPNASSGVMMPASARKTTAATKMASVGPSSLARA